MYELEDITFTTEYMVLASSFSQAHVSEYNLLVFFFVFNVSIFKKVWIKKHNANYGVYSFKKYTPAYSVGSVGCSSLHTTGPLD